MAFPELTKNMLHSIEEAAAAGSYTVNIEGLPITVFPFIFPPTSPFSKSSGTLATNAHSLKGQRVLDIGTGTGVQAILAAKEGAKLVHAIDILPEAVACAAYNVRANGFENIVQVYDSDIFSNVPQQQFDTIIANLPIVEHPTDDLKQHSLFDPGFIYHERLFREAPRYLVPQGRIVLCHADLDGPEGFSKLESLAKKHGFTAHITAQIEDLGYTWRNYEFRR